MDLVRKLADRLINLSALIGTAALAVLVCVILINVIGSQFGYPLYGALDVTIMTMVIVVFGGMALCDRRGGHISVDLLERKFPDGLNRAIDAGSAVLGAVIFVTLAWAVYESAQISELLNLSTNLLRLPKAWFQYALCALAVFTALGMSLRAVEIAFTGRDVRRDETHLQ